MKPFSPRPSAVFVAPYNHSPGTKRNGRIAKNAQQQAHTLSGLHADYILFVLDESGGIPQAVVATAEAVLSSGIEAKDRKVWEKTWVLVNIFGKLRQCL